MTSWSIDWSFFSFEFQTETKKKNLFSQISLLCWMLISISRLPPCQGLSPHFHFQLRSYLKIKKCTAWHPKTWFKKLVSSWDILGCHEVPGLRHLIWLFVVGDLCLLLNVIWKQYRTNLTVNFLFLEELWSLNFHLYSLQVQEEGCWEAWKLITILPNLALD